MGFDFLSLYKFCPASNIYFLLFTQIFGDLPSEEAKIYGDSIFGAMMYAKVLVVHLVNSLRYDVLFQDVDVTWYQNPLEFFHNKTTALVNFDILLQDDGARSLRYAPYSGNSGFYFVRSNSKTRHLFMSLVYSADLVLMWKSHQQVLSTLLVEHASLFGLRVKTLEDRDFPGEFEDSNEAET